VALALGTKNPREREMVLVARPSKLGGHRKNISQIFSQHLIVVEIFTIW
jgi:hypothetical protein